MRLVCLAHFLLTRTLHGTAQILHNSFVVVLPYQHAVESIFKLEMLRMFEAMRLEYFVLEGSRYGVGDGEIGRIFVFQEPEKWGDCCLDDRYLEILAKMLG